MEWGFCSRDFKWGLESDIGAENLSLVLELVLLFVLKYVVLVLLLWCGYICIIFSGRRFESHSEQIYFYLFKKTQHITVFFVFYKIGNIYGLQCSIWPTHNASFGLPTMHHLAYHNASFSLPTMHHFGLPTMHHAACIFTSVSSAQALLKSLRSVISQYMCFVTNCDY